MRITICISILVGLQRSIFGLPSYTLSQKMCFRVGRPQLFSWKSEDVPHENTSFVTKCRKVVQILTSGDRPKSIYKWLVAFFVVFWKNIKKSNHRKGAACGDPKWGPQKVNHRKGLDFYGSLKPGTGRYAESWLQPPTPSSEQYDGSSPTSLKLSIIIYYHLLSSIIIYYFLLSSIIIYWKVNIWTTFRHFVSKDVFSHGTSSLFQLKKWGRPTRKHIFWDKVLEGSPNIDLWRPTKIDFLRTILIFWCFFLTNKK